MKLTNATEKAFAVIAIIGTQVEGQLVPSSIIVDRLNISDSYTKKLLRKLVVADLITSIPGNNGGFKLNRPSNEICILDVIEAIEGKVDTYPGYGTLEHAFNEFPESISHGEEIVKNVLAEADRKWREELAKCTLAMILEQSFGERDVTKNWKELRIHE